MAWCAPLSLQAYDEVVGYLLGCEGGNFASDDNGLCLDMVEDRVGRLVRWIIEVLNVLCDNISRKARQFEQQALRCIFLINNYDYILQYVPTLCVCVCVCRVCRVLCVCV